MTVRLLLTGAGGTALLQSCQASKADELAHAARWRQAVQQQVGALDAIELHNADSEDAREMLVRLHDVVIDIHRRPDGQPELVGLYLYPPAPTDAAGSQLLAKLRGTPRVLHVGAKLRST